MGCCNERPRGGGPRHGTSEHERLGIDGDGMKMLVLGGGGREHAIVDRLNESPKVADVRRGPG